ncbi:gclc protein [Colletotrichum higginsianum]|uniref:Glutamate--cysteine ligase n=2 Tax=Colletotrichum destructivum species complex TaxID=2707350 RepID=H1W247_COLHI|nr:gclc protein [Colletotrichum higginsianum]
MTVNEIINGSPDGDATGTGFPGLIPLVESYLDGVNVDVQTRCELDTYLRLISRRASGELDTAARWLRNFIDAHPAYRHDSVVGDDIQKDIIAAVIAIGERETAGEGFAGLDIHGLPRLLGNFRRGGCGGSA